MCGPEHFAQWHHKSSEPVHCDSDAGLSTGPGRHPLTRNNPNLLNLSVLRNFQLLFLQISLLYFLLPVHLGLQFHVFFDIFAVSHMSVKPEKASFLFSLSVLLHLDIFYSSLFLVTKHFCCGYHCLN